MPVNFNRKRIEKWKSKIFQIDDEFENFTLPNDSDKEGWVFSDTNLKNIVPKDINSDFTIAITNVPLENNYYSRRIDNNLIIITFFQMKEILENKNIPLENIILRLIYGYCLVYLKYGHIISHKNELLTTYQTLIYKEQKYIFKFDIIGQEINFYHNKRSFYL